MCFQGICHQWHLRPRILVEARSFTFQNRTNRLPHEQQNQSTTNLLGKCSLVLTCVFLDISIVNIWWNDIKCLQLLARCRPSGCSVTWHGGDEQNLHWFRSLEASKSRHRQALQQRCAELEALVTELKRTKRRTRWRRHWSRNSAQIGQIIRNDRPWSHPEWFLSDWLLKCFPPSTHCQWMCWIAVPSDPVWFVAYGVRFGDDGRFVFFCVPVSHSSGVSLETMVWVKDNKYIMVTPGQWNTILYLIVAISWRCPVRFRWSLKLLSQPGIYRWAINADIATQDQQTH